MSTRKIALGRWGEATAADYLADRGYTVLEKNARTPYGELDLVARIEDIQSPVIVFVEVKTRASSALGPPEISVDQRKRAHLEAAAQAYMLAHPGLPQTWRIDVIAIRRTPDESKPEILHFENALTAT